MRGLAILLPSLVAILFAACSLFGDDEQQTARISEKGIDGIYFGDCIDDVLEKLGHPDAVGWIDGPWRPWYHFTYGTLPGDTIRIRFTIPSGGPDSLSVVDAFGVRNSYSGTTAQGIGIGSTTEEILEAFGKPAYEREAVNRILYYCIGVRQVDFEIRADTLRLILMGFNEPMEDYYVDCKE